SLQPKVVEKLGQLDWKQLSVDNQLGLLRAYGLLFTRFGEPTPEVRESVLARFDKLFPSNNWQLNRELSRLLIYLEAPNVTGRCLDLTAKAGTQEEAIHYP